MNSFTNRTFDEIAVGDSAMLVRTLRQEDIQMYAIMSGDINPSHVDPEYAHHGVGRALLAELFANLGALRVERVETVVATRDLALLGFLLAAGFTPSQRLPFMRALDAAAPL